MALHLTHCCCLQSRKQSTCWDWGSGYPIWTPQLLRGLTLLVTALVQIIALRAISCKMSKLVAPITAGVRTCTTSTATIASAGAVAPRTSLRSSSPSVCLPLCGKCGTFGKSRPYVLLDLNLSEPVNVIFNRISAIIYCGRQDVIFLW